MNRPPTLFAAGDDRTSSQPRELSLSSAAELIAARELASSELVESCLEAVHSCNNIFHALITLDEGGTRRAAADADSAILRGEHRGPMHGIPVVLKDNVQTRGLRTTAGSKILGDWVPKVDAVVASRLRGSGAVILGKANMHEFCLGITSENPHYGDVVNALDSTRAPLGSSGGCAAAVAAGMCLGALGSDTGGSVRLPSATHGLVGLRPTLGSVPCDGVVPLSWSLDTVGPICRTAKDAQLVLNALAGGSSGAPRRSTERPRVGLVRGWWLERASPSVRSALEALVREMVARDTDVCEVTVDGIEKMLAAQAVIELSEAASIHSEWLASRPADYGSDVLELLELGARQLAMAYVEAQRFRGRLRRTLDAVFEDRDVLLSPMLPCDVPLRQSETVRIGEETETMFDALQRYTNLAPLAALPAVTFPYRLDEAGMPTGVQLVGPPRSESRLLQIAAEYEWQGRA